MSAERTGMKKGRRVPRILMAGAVLAIASCGTGPDSDEAPPSESEDPIVSEVPGPPGGLVGQVDRARGVASDLEQRNTSLESELP